MITALTLLTFVTTGAIGFCLGRFRRCNNLCLRQRIHILECISRLQMIDGANALRALRLFRSVSYEAHLAALFFGRDPIELYRAAERRLGQ